MRIIWLHYMDEQPLNFWLSLVGMLAKIEMDLPKSISTACGYSFGILMTPSNTKNTILPMLQHNSSKKIKTHNDSDCAN